MVIRIIAQAALSLLLVAMGPSPASKAFLAPDGLKPCPPEDPLATAQSRLATKLGGEFLGCFRSDDVVTAISPAPQVSTPIEYAFALALHDHQYSVGDLHELLSKTEQQWKDFKPINGELPDAYIAKLNELIGKQSNTDNNASVSSVRPLLVKIDASHESYYTVTSIRSYVIAAVGASMTVTKVNADALLVRDSRLVRLTIQRSLTGSADVARVQADIDQWARSIA